MKILQFVLFALYLPAAIQAAGAEDCETKEKLCVSSEIFLIDGEDAVPYPNSTIVITDSRTTNVTFSITQDFSETSVDYIYPVFDFDGREMVCAEENAMVDVAPGYTQTFTAECDQWGKASVELFVRHNAFTDISAESNYRNCVNLWGSSRVATYKIQLSCDGTPVCGPDYEAEMIAEAEAAEEGEFGFKCRHPENTNRYSVITRGDAEISASNLYKAVAIGGTMSNPVGNKMVIGSKRAHMSYMYGLIGKCLMDFKGYRQIGAYLRKVIDFEHFEYLARNAESHKFPGKKIIVMTRGGTFDIRDFCTVCEGKRAESGESLLIIFNTDEKVALKGSADGLPFLASVVAPFSRVELDGSAGYIDGIVVADTFATVGDHASSLELRGRHMEGDFYCGRTEAPTWAPTTYKPETHENICLTGQILLTNDEDVKPLPDKVIAIEKAEESTVTFSITNQWKNMRGWIIPVFAMTGRKMECASGNRMVRPKNGERSTFTAKCYNGTAKVVLYVREPRFRESTQQNVYNCPGWWGGTRHKGVYEFQLSCSDEEICTDYTTVPATEPELPEPEPDHCKMPMFAERYAVITKSHAEISMHEIQNGIAIGGLLSNPMRTSVLVGSKWTDGKSYLDRLVDECPFEFKGGRLIGKPLEEVLDFQHFEQVAQNAFNRTEGGMSVIVMNHGGTFDTHDFLPGFKPHQADNRNTVVVFNTTETVILNRTNDGQPFRPSVIAPFSRVELHSDAGFMEGSIVAHSFATTGSNPSALSMSGKAYAGRFCDPPNKEPEDTWGGLGTTSGNNTFNEHPDPPIEEQSEEPGIALSTTSNHIIYNEPLLDDRGEEESENDIPIPASGSLGDPHFRTWKNEHFEYHGQCDLLLATDPNFADGLGLDVQIRTKLVRFWSYIQTSAIRIGDDIFEFQGDALPEESSGPKYWFNLEYQGNLDTIGGFPIVMIRNSPLKTMFEIDLHSKYPGQKITIGAYKEFVRIDFHNGSEE
eukprot:scaffold120_cov59-Cylindrotheca_fusiformis.AAC.18